MKNFSNYYPFIFISLCILFLVFGFGSTLKINKTQKEIQKEAYLKGYKDCQEGYLPKKFQKNKRRNSEIKIKKFRG